LPLKSDNKRKEVINGEKVYDNFAASHQCPINKELALKELEVRKSDVTTKDEALKRE